MPTASTASKVLAAAGAQVTRKGASELLDSLTADIGATLFAFGVVVVAITAGFFLYWRKVLDRPHYGVRFGFLAGAFIAVMSLAVAVIGSKSRR